ncbi:MerR family transcriptional regulator [Pediococcus claussenii]|uniref:Transcriptional regulator, MerR family n=1 Tax=Pediococcus claussenii (strain ATCC BAA-344 / DSM 14800 / JCM 18046 / KCTC 3811 / LMG 21948 / P06) TaxID=701521 RepID=G8PBS9_PEDCP|nr:MerR family transcriptional regulator [Pediococcus claussenii]AEV95987.1 Transcriptional regulator, MerR family [Pediococcus claussenii ATCC BAA-344]ANZ69473.1 hypothetical protein AYR57_03740 [Pediococcus claussenii]ANZ71293.1 hypothetical protein AYR58_03755 [Pediococcus claussenii]
MHSISEVSKQFNVTYDTLRYYEEKGLLSTVKRDSRGRRIYSDSNLDELNRIIHMRQLGATVNEILDLKRTDLSKEDLYHVLDFLNTLNKRLENQAKNIHKQKEFIESKRAKILNDIRTIDSKNKA